MHSVIRTSITAQKPKLYWLFIKNKKKKKIMLMSSKPTLTFSVSYSTFRSLYPETTFVANSVSFLVLHACHLQCLFKD